MAAQNNNINIMSSHESIASKESKRLVPKLRFKEFEGKWSLERLGNICDKIQDGNYGASYPKSNEFIPEGIPFLTSKALGGDGFLNKDKIDFISIEKHNELKKAQLKLNDVLFTNRGANVGTIGFVDETIAHGNIGPQLTLLRSDDLKISSVFLRQIMTSFSVVKQIRSQDSGSAMNFFGIKATSRFKLVIPSLPEQQKIAQFLTAVDSKLQQLNQKKELLEQYKKGVMQQLFSQQLRFKKDDGSDYPDLERVRFTDCCELIHGFQFRKEHFTTTGIPIIKIGSLVDNGGLTFDNATYVDEKHKADFPKFTLKKGDILMALTGGTLGKVSKISKDYGLIFQNYRVGKFEPKSNSVKEYIYFILLSNLVQNRVKSLVNEAAQPNFGKQDFDKIKFSLPSIEEQQKIANYLSAIDTKIETVTQQIEATQQFKKGLLQQMFV